MPEPQTTLASQASFAGVGVHSGAPCRVTLAPAPADSGVRFVRTDLEGDPEIPVRPESVSTEPMLRQTILRKPARPEAQVRTVEHILATLYAMDVDNARIEMTSAEAPIGDGSAMAAAQAVRDADIVPIDGSHRKVVAIERPLRFSPADAPEVEYSAWPSETLTVTYFLDYDHPVIGSQAAECLVDPEVFVEELAGARTFCTEQEIEYLRAQGLIRGGSPDNAIVVGEAGVLNTTLRWDNELARHKLVDLLGDLFLLGVRLRGRIAAHRAGHQTNALFLEYLRKELLDDE